ncbi:MAG: type II toxin-antitoxin system Phd/YefM family antitoxin, partial [Nocardioidaceae bacterium]
MDTVGVRDLANRVSAVLDELEQGGQSLIVTRRGHPVAVLSAIDAEEFYDYVLARA